MSEQNLTELAKRVLTSVDEWASWDDIVATARRVVDLEAMVERLPKTADGVPVVPGMVIHVPGNWVDHVEKVARVDVHGVWTDYPGTVFAGGRLDLSMCYSTCEAAAESARAEGSVEP